MNARRGCRPPSGAVPFWLIVYNSGRCSRAILLHIRSLDGEGSQQRPRHIAFTPDTRRIAATRRTDASGQKQNSPRPIALLPDAAGRTSQPSHPVFEDSRKLVRSWSGWKWVDLAAPHDSMIAHSDAVVELLLAT